MLAKFRKIGVASAVAATLGASGAAQAVVLGEPGSALLVPHVLYSSTDQVNTMIAVTVGSNVNSKLDLTGTAVTFDALTDTFEGDPALCNDNAQIHLYFFDVDSNHKGDVPISITCEDFVRIDWSQIVQTKLKSLDGVPGYAVISDGDSGVRAGTAESALALWGTSYFIQGNWASEAYIPVLPLYDTVDDDPADEVIYTATVPSQVNPIYAGMDLATGGTADTAFFSLRYFDDPNLSGGTTLVLWFPDNGDRSNLPIDVFDCDENPVSTSITISKELNIIQTSTLDGTENTGTRTDAAFGPCDDQGFIEFAVTDGVNGTADVPRAGIAFSLIQINGANALQVQTELAHERGVVVGGATLPQAPAVPPGGATPGGQTAAQQTATQ
jgi:hypothetical protein